MRKGPSKKRILAPDPKFNDTLVNRFVNCLMKEGKKNLAYSIFYRAIDKITEQTGEDGLEVWRRGLGNVMPSVEVKRRKIGGATLQLPIEVRPDRKISLGIKWQISAAVARNEKSMVDKLANEIIASSKGEGNACKRKSDTHKMAESNRAFSHHKIK